MATGRSGGLSPNRHDLGTPKNNHKYDTPCDPVNTYTIYQDFLYSKNIVGFHLHARKYDFIQPMKRMAFPVLISTKITSADHRPFTHIYTILNTYHDKYGAYEQKIVDDPN
jgi:hypothetical protein